MNLPIPHATKVLVRERAKARQELQEIERKIAARVLNLRAELASSPEYAAEIAAELAALEVSA